jgi:hypothetical protein
VVAGRQTIGYDRGDGDGSTSIYRIPAVGATSTLVANARAPSSSKLGRLGMLSHPFQHRERVLPMLAKSEDSTGDSTKCTSETNPARMTYGGMRVCAPAEPFLCAW